MHPILILAAIYGTLVGGNFVKAPYAAKTAQGTTETASLTEAQANAIGYKLLVDERPACAPDEYAVAVGYEEGARIVRKYEKRKMEPEPRVFDKYDISVAAMEYGEITNLVGFVNADVGTKWMWDNSDVIEESNPFFVSGTNAVVQSGAITDAKVKAILDRAWQLGQEGDK